jgi:hypothetical protein
MALHQKDENASAIRLYFKRVIDWIKDVFPVYQPKFAYVIQLVMGTTNLITGNALGMSYGTTTITGIITITTITPMGL